MSDNPTSKSLSSTLGRLSTSWLLRTVLSALSGVSMWAAFPPRNLWFFAIVSMALLAWVFLQPGLRKRSGFWCGFVYGLGFFLPLLPWIGVYVGALPWVALSTVLALYCGLFGVVAAVTMRLPGRVLWFATAWSLIEWLRSSFPFGGFPWARMAFGQVESPLLPIVAVGGAPLLSFALALTGAGIAVLIRELCSARRVRSIAIAVVAVVAAPITAAAATPGVNAHNTSDRTVRVAAIQGNVPRLGLDFNEQRRAVLDNHIKETLRLAERVNSGQEPRPDIVMWPENASDIDPIRNDDAAEEISAASKAVGAPIMVGSLLFNDDSRPTNTVLVWDGDQVKGRYDKHIIQPFGEYLPWRSFFRLFSSYADRAGNFRPGTGPAALEIDVRGEQGNRTIPVGIATCWEVAFDRAGKQAVDDGAQVLYVPTNNATFGRTEMTYQQLAMSQIRAVEHGRSVVVAATSGVSAIVSPDGSATEKSQFFTPATLSAIVPLHTDRTLATRLGPWPEYLLIALSVLALLVAALRRTRFEGLKNMPVTERDVTPNETRGV